MVVPEEAELLMPRLRRLHSPRVWLLSYAAPVTKSMQALSSRAYSFIPSDIMDDPLPTWLTVELNVFAGGLHFKFEHYEPLLAWLQDTSTVGISSSKVECKLVAEQPLKFLLEWLTYRRQTEEIHYTPMGFVCQRKPLRPDHDFFVTGHETPYRGSMKTVVPGRVRTSSEDEDEDSSWEADSVISEAGEDNEQLN